MFGMGWQELIIVLIIVVIIFGVGKLPEIGSALGRGIKNFKKSMNDQQNEITDNSSKKEEDKK